MAASRRRSRQYNVLPVAVAAVLGVLAGAWTAHHDTAIGMGAGLLAGIVLTLLLGGRRASAGAMPADHPSARTPSRTPAAPALPATKAGRRAGWLEPANRDLIAIEVSDECANEQCAICPGSNSGCTCPCGHNSALIVARNQARIASPADEDDEPQY